MGRARRARRFPYGRGGYESKLTPFEVVLTAYRSATSFAAARHEALQRLSIRDTAVRDLSPLADLPNLKWLTMRGCAATDLTPLLLLPLGEGTLPRSDDTSAAAETLRERGLR